MLDTHELAWAAGFFDGEGSIGAHHKNGVRYYVAHLIVNQASRNDDVPPALVRFQKAILGIGKINGPYTRPNRNSLPIYQFQTASFQNVQATMAMLWTWLLPRSRQRFAHALYLVSLRQKAKRAGREWTL